MRQQGGGNASNGALVRGCPSLFASVNLDFGNIETRVLTIAAHWTAIHKKMADRNNLISDTHVT